MGNDATTSTSGGRSTTNRPPSTSGCVAKPSSADASAPVEEIPLAPSTDKERSGGRRPAPNAWLVIAGLALLIGVIVVLGWGGSADADPATAGGVAPTPTATVGAPISPPESQPVSSTPIPMPAPTSIPEATVAVVFGDRTINLIVPNAAAPMSTAVLPDGEVRIVTREPWSIVARETDCPSDMVERDVRNTHGLLVVRRAANRVLLCDPGVRLQLVIESTDGVAEAMANAVALLGVSRTGNPLDW